MFGTNLQTAATFILGYNFYCFYKQLPLSTTSDTLVAPLPNEFLAGKCEHDEWFTQTVLMTFAFDDQEELNSRDELVCIVWGSKCCKGNFPHGKLQQSKRGREISPPSGANRPLAGTLPHLRCFLLPK